MKYLSNIALIVLFIISSITFLLIHPWTLSSEKYGTMTDWIGAEFSIFSFIALVITLRSQLEAQKEQQIINRFESERFKNETMSLFSFALRNFHTQLIASGGFINRKFQIIIENIATFRALNITFDVPNNPWILGQYTIDAVVPRSQHILGVTYHESVDNVPLGTEMMDLRLLMIYEDLNKNKYTQILR